MRIGLFCPEPLGAGGIGSYTATHARALAAMGHDVWVGLRAGTDAGSSLPGVKVEVIAPLEPFRIPTGNRYWGLSLGALPWAAGVAHSRIERRFDVLEVPEWLAGGLFLGPNPPLVIRLHSHLALVRRLNALGMTPDARLACHFERLALRHSRLILANSEALADELSRDYAVERSEIDVLPLGIDLARFQPLESNLKARVGLGAEDVLMLFVGRLEKRKGVEDLFTAFLQVAGLQANLHLALAGRDTETGPHGVSMRAHLAARACASGLSERVHWLGDCQSEAMPALYAGCDFLAAPSSFESFGLVYLEAMACGRPVIACNAGGVLGLVQDGREGLLVPPQSPSLLAEAIMALARDGARRCAMGAAALQKARQFDAHAMARRAVHHYETVMRSPYSQFARRSS